MKNSAQDLMEALKAYVVTDEIPKGYYSVVELEEALNMSETKVRRLLDKKKAKKAKFCNPKTRKVMFYYSL